MVDIEPYEYQRKTNVKEHNDLVAKINEIVDVINNTNLDTIIPRIDKIETDISGINSTDALQWQDIESVKDDIGTITPKITKLEQDVTDINSTDAVQNTNISNLKTKDSEHDTRLGNIDSEIVGITKSLVSDVAILNGTTSGNVKVRIEREDAPSIDSNDYNLQKPTSVELIQGSAPAMVKAQITLSDGTVLISDDFMFTTEAIGQDVYISSFVFKNGNVAGSISADIGLSNGSTLTANNFVVPTDPNVTSAISGLQGRVTTVENDVSGLKTTVNGHTTSINGLDSEVSDLQTRMTAVEGGTIVGLDELKQTVDGHTVSINALDSDVADLQIDKADVNNGNQSIVAGSISANNITKGGVDVATINDIPAVPDISGKADLNNANQTIVAGSVNATNITKGGVNVATVNDIPTLKIQKIALSKEGTGINGYLSPCIQYDRVVFATFSFNDDEGNTTTLYNGSMTYYGSEDGYKEFVGSCYRAVSSGNPYDTVSFVFKIGSSSSFLMIANRSNTPYSIPRTPTYAYASAFIERITY